MKLPSPKGMTLIEMLMVVVVISILVVLAVPSYAWLRNRAGYAGCVSRLRILHAGFNSYMQDHDMIWPQLPGGPNMQFPNESAEWEWWFKQLEKYDVGKTHWVCPNDKQGNQVSDKKDAPEYYSSYIPTAFDENPNTAFRWKQPWVIERGGFHYKNKGANMLMPDGTIEHAPPIPIP